jgi:hypothetical protein
MVCDGKTDYWELMRAPWFFTLLSLFVAAAVAQAAEPVEYCPMAEGAEWTMDAKVTTPEGKVIDATAHRRVGAKEEREGKIYFRMRTWMDGIPELQAFETLVRREEAGLFSIDLRDAGSKEGLSMKLPFVVGSKWTRDQQGTQVTSEVVAREDLKINGTTYKDCYKIKIVAKDGSYQEDLWQAPGKGSIKSDVVLSGGARISVTLREFKPGGK